MENGFTLPRVRVSCAFPSSSKQGSIVGQCWGTSCSDDGVNEIFITPFYSKPYEVLDTLTHELVHAVDNCKSKHGKEFKKHYAKLRAVFVNPLLPDQEEMGRTYREFKNIVVSQEIGTTVRRH